MPRKFMITGALPYSNGRLHVGHIAGAYLPADIYVRYLRARGDDVRFICGSDDNGVASLISAAQGRPDVEELTGYYNARQAADFEGLGIEFDIYGGTHQPDFVELHNQISQDFFKTIYDKGYFVKKTTKQLYDVQAGKFLPDRYVKGTCYTLQATTTRPTAISASTAASAIDPLHADQPGQHDHRHAARGPRDDALVHAAADSSNEPLREWLEQARAADGCPPGATRCSTSSLGQIKQGLPERAMTRDLDWGVPVPLDDPDAKGKVLYVWFDAPIGYVSFTAKYVQNSGKGD